MVTFRYTVSSMISHCLLYLIQIGSHRPEIEFNIFHMPARIVHMEIGVWWRGKLVVKLKKHIAAYDETWEANLTSLALGPQNIR